MKISVPPTRSRLSRRKFLVTSALLLAGGTAPGCAAADRKTVAAPKVGAQLYGWGQYAQRAGKNFNDQLPQVLESLRRSGYDYAEGTLDAQALENNARFADKLKKAGLSPAALYTGGRFHEKEKAAETVQRLVAAAAAAREAGFKIINCNPDPIGRTKTDEELAMQAAALNDFGRGLADLGMGLGIHNLQKRRC